MKICFFGWRRAFDYYQIGGTESFVRRISCGLLELGNEVEYVMYDIKGETFNVKKEQGITLNYENSFKKALKLLTKKNFDCIISIYVHPKYKLPFMLYRKKNSRKIIFCTIAFSPKITGLKGKLGMIELKSYDLVFAITQRSLKEITKHKINTKIIDPPIPKTFFETFSLKSLDNVNKISVVYIGRADFGKGFDVVLKSFDKLDKSVFETKIITYYWPEERNIKKMIEKYESTNSIEISEYFHYTVSLERTIATYLLNADILLLPYRTLKTTIDLPLSLFEGVVMRCKIVTSGFNPKELFTKDIYENIFTLKPQESYVDKIQEISNRKNIFNNYDILSKYKQDNIARYLLNIISRIK